MYGDVSSLSARKICYISIDYTVFPVCSRPKIARLYSGYPQYRVNNSEKSVYIVVYSNKLSNIIQSINP